VRYIPHAKLMSYPVTVKLIDTLPFLFKSWA
jgi:hypothetical protein